MRSIGSSRVAHTPDPKRDGLFWTAGLGNLQALKLSDHILPCGLGTHFWVDVEDSTVGTDVERPSRGQLTLRVHDAVRRRHFLLGIAQGRVSRLRL